MIDRITLLRAAQAGLPASGSHPDTPLHSFPLRLDWESTLPVERALYPTPTITTRDGVEPAAWPGAVRLMERFAQAHRWRAKRQYSRGCAPHGATGRPLAERDWYGICLAREDRSAWLVHDGTKWDSMALWAQDVAPVVGAIPVALMKEWIEGVPRPQEFVAEVRGALAKAALRKREKARAS